MDLKVAFAVVCLCALAIVSTEAGIPRCCMATKRYIHPRVLLKVQRWEMQQNSGACDIPALILYGRDMKKPICAHPKVKTALMRLQERIKQNRQKASY